ncbi:helix-hairpin-helix domain-containing protein [Patescibacteria group bacterium]|nr:helix-hairpin-helix domain-containing protein [Patescibacteria group bacterium]
MVQKSDELHLEQLEKDGEKPKFNFEEFLDKYKLQLILLLVGILFVGLGTLLFKDGLFGGSDKIEVLETNSGSEVEILKMVVEVAGAVERPGVYEFLQGDRVEDLLIAGGGVSGDADREWMEKFINRAAKLIDGQKLYIPSKDEVASTNSDWQSNNASANFSGTSDAVLGSVENMVNINTATQKELESLWGIGPVTAQNIIEQRLYSSVEELLTKKILKTNVYERNKNLMSVY